MIRKIKPDRYQWQDQSSFLSARYFNGAESYIDKYVAIDGNIIIGKTDDRYRYHIGVLGETFYYSCYDTNLQTSCKTYKIPYHALLKWDLNELQLTIIQKDCRSS